ncbi:MAG: DUF4835 family protein [[Clostridium] fimetarium]|nr:DUF4835 family protein [Alistipes timonensis]MCM1406419.1 DUF4835 family protein [[Clostridium] fimetarium]
MNNPLSIRKLLSGLLLLLAALLPGRAAAQELNCQVEINSDQMQGTNKSVFESLQQAVNDYLNTTHFTNMQFNANERIDCRFFLTVKEYADNVLKGDLQIQSSRPTYNASYTTTLLNFKDTRIEFQYQEGEPLVFSTTSMESQLTAILNFYAYLIIALDGDSMAPRGGEEQWEQLKMIVQFAQSAGEPGWKAFEDKRNRSAVLGAFTDPATNAVRDMLYKYHRQGLDEMALSPDKGRAQITESLSTLQKVYDHDPMSVFLAMFMDSKLDELVNIYTKASQTERDKVVEILQPLYPTEMKRINFIKQGVNK